jgi:diadenosine tetraphosphate (Ap4A) HIT family hydrolase
MIYCPRCKDAPLLEEGQLLWRGDDCRVILVENADLPGFCRVIWNRHVAEMSDLSYGEREHLMGLVFAIEAAVRHVMEPDKINLASLGNHVAHLHWHVIPRYQDDAYFPGSVWSTKTQETSHPVLAMRQQKALRLPAAIRSAIANLY